MCANHTRARSGRQPTDPSAPLPQGGAELTPLLLPPLVSLEAGGPAQDPGGPVRRNAALQVSGVPLSGIISTSVKGGVTLYLDSNIFKS